MLADHTCATAGVYSPTLAVLDITGLIATHTHATGGYYEITLAAKDDDGLVGTCTRGIQLPDSFLPPIAAFTMTTSGLDVAADGSGSWDADGVIVSYMWYWGDGTTGSGMTAFHTYQAAGLYSISLTVTDNDGLTCTMSSNVISIGQVPQQTSRLIIDDTCPEELSPEGGSAHT